MMKEEYDLKVIALEIDQTEKDLQEMAYKLSGEMGFYLTISGFDDDSRELWQIPEAIDLCRRIVKTGFIAVLEASSSVEGIRTSDSDPGLGILTHAAFIGLGAFEVWVFSEGRMKSGGVTFSKNDIFEFYNVLVEAQEKLKKLRTDRIEMN
jgi:hypothetical protein